MFTDPPTQVTISGTTTGKADDDIELVCTTMPSNPQAAITWYAGTRYQPSSDFEVRAADGGGVIAVAKLKVKLKNEDDNVVYSCRAQNSKWSVTIEASVTLSVQCKYCVMTVGIYIYSILVRDLDCIIHIDILMCVP